jgi:hypothetical protein
MIELDALKQQLALLGHDLPDDQIQSILKEMHIDFGEGVGRGGRVGLAPRR